MIYKPTLLKSNLNQYIPQFSFTPIVQLLSRSVVLFNDKTVETYEYSNGTKVTITKYTIVTYKTKKGRRVIRKNKTAS